MMPSTTSLLAVFVALAANSGSADTARWESDGWDSTWGAPHTTYLAEEPCDLVRLNRDTATSARCLSCHDGGVAEGPLFRIGLDRTTTERHPVGVPYTSAADRFGHSRLVPIGALPEELVLPNGKVECVTCHAADGVGPARTALPMDGSTLCLSCHDM